MSNVLISEVGPRDGLQNCKSIMPTALKLRWIEAAAKAGLREVEVGSFVNPKLLPQVADTAEVVAGARHIDGLEIAVLVPNIRGAKAAVESGAHKMTLPLSVSETHSIKNVNRTHPQMLDEARAIMALLAEIDADNRPHFEVSLSTLFGCTIEGTVSEKKIATLTEELTAIGVDEIGLSDTTGYANPVSVRQMISLTRSIAGDGKINGIHLHNTRGLGLANALAAFEEGLTTFDSSLGGLGGCPTAPGASGNIVTEDLVYMFEAMGVSTGVDIDGLLECRKIVEAALPDEELFGFIPEAGRPLGATY
ncbi:hydroxymethylglutaryl-CoA lyase [Parvularcula marina]|uniref:Hydroxymethylglutaryl-CoA lyase n=1 Tax=Parvularcula marina TaxID=2292771 RepID=A0A371RI26_9PROT|nr:hydroxymethylglutaryl-CoA lyase [Parvularcula marina]RFB05109.1 hydroxymethylglutaryl-CoA lyase [Parvularcula marina]